MAMVTRFHGPCRMTTENCEATTFLRMDGLAPTVGVTTYSPCCVGHKEAVDLVADRMASGTTEGLIQEVIDGKHGRMAISLQMPRDDFYEWRMSDGSVVRTREQEPPEVKP